jgi:hypothetical protein
MEKKENQKKIDKTNLSCVMAIRMKKADLQKLKELAVAENRTISNYVKTKLKIKN